MYKEFGISDKLLELSNQVEKGLQEIFKDIDKICELNSIKVLKAFKKYSLSDMHFSGTTGYGYGDIGRDVCEQIFSEIFNAEDALVRTQLVSGTHALTTAFFGILRPGDTILSITGKPYDTLNTVIGITENQSSLLSYKIEYEQIDLIDGKFDLEQVKKRVSEGNLKVITIQRSRGYEVRKSMSLKDIEEVIREIKLINKEVIIIVDNCYGEFVDTTEPIELGADIVVGSLIKNLGGGIAPTGAYITGKKKLIELIADRLTVPGQGKEIGSTLGINKQILQGLFFAPQVVASSLKTAVFASRIMEELGYKVSPRYNEKRTDIVQMIEFGEADKVIKFCQGIQKASAVDSNVVPEPWDMPGYEDKIIMASGSFIQGSSIEFSCDAPIRPPYAAFLQGGLTYHYGKLRSIACN